jgi:hypothetical protein
MQTQHTYDHTWYCQIPSSQVYSPFSAAKLQSSSSFTVQHSNTRFFATTLMTCNAQGTARHIHSSINPGLKPTMTKYNQLLLQKISPLDVTVTEPWMEYKALNWIGTRSALEIILYGHNSAYALRIQHGVRQNLQK